jgi:galactose-1-phosphate uridylyltransferase
MATSDETNKIKSNYMSMFKSDGGKHLYKKIIEMEQTAMERAIGSDDEQLALHSIYEARGLRRLRSYIDLATDSKLK